MTEKSIKCHEGWCKCHGRKTNVGQEELAREISAFQDKTNAGQPESRETMMCALDTQLNSINQLIFVMVKYGVLFEVRTEFLNNI
jgi:hypothetical protein